MNRISRSAALAAALMTALPVAAVHADKPKRGYYIDVKLQTYVVVAKNRRTITSFQTQCPITREDGSTTLSGTISLPRTKRLSVSSTGRFSYTGTLNQAFGTGISPVKGTIKGTFTGGKAKGTLTIEQPTACQVTAFSGRYYGVNPQG